jgi:hypothetical protein
MGYAMAEADIVRRARKLVEGWAVQELEVLVPYFERLDYDEARCGTSFEPSRSVRQKMLRRILADCPQHPCPPITPCLMPS